MSAKTALVADGYLYDPQQAGSSIRLDTAAWFGWLSQASTNSFSYPLYDAQRGYIVGFMTVRKERRQRGGMYWSVFRRAGGKVRKIYVGQPAAVTQAKLHSIAEMFREIWTNEQCSVAPITLTDVRY